MAVDVNIQQTDQMPLMPPAPPIPPPKAPPAIASLKIKKMLDGSFVVFDHPDMDIVVMPTKNKVLAIAKDEMGDHIYAAQSRLFDYLKNKGIIELNSVGGGNIYSSLEAQIMPNEEMDSIQTTLYIISRFVNEELPYYDKSQDYEDELEDHLLEPSEENSTELGEVPHERFKGSMYRYPGYPQQYNLGHMYRA